MTQPSATEPPETEQPATEPESTAPQETQPQETLPETTEPSVPEEVPDVDTELFYATITMDQVDGAVSRYCSSSVVNGAAVAMSTPMMKTAVQDALSRQIQNIGKKLAGVIGSSFTVDGDMLASAFQFNMNEEELQRLMMAMAGQATEVSATANLQTLGYADLDVPISMSIYLLDFAAKEEFIDFLDAYNDLMEEQEKEDQVIRYTDVTGIMMSSVRTIIDSVSYALIAFVAVSLVVSSIMIGIITYISVMERTKEIGVLRAIGASKKNVSSMFNAETVMIGFASGVLGVLVTVLLCIPINAILHVLTGIGNLNAYLPWQVGLALIVISVLLTLIAGVIPSRSAAKKDPVVALRTE